MTVFRIEYKNRKIGEFLELSKAMSFVDMALANPSRVGIDAKAKRADLVLSSYEFEPEPLINETQVQELMKHVGGDRVVAADMASGRVTIHFSSERIQTDRGWFDEEEMEMVGETYELRPCDKEVTYIYDIDVCRFLELR